MKKRVAKFILEICVDSVESAVNAQSAGADRIELCAGLIEGGTTPSYGTILAARHNLDIGLHVIIRPRGGDFLYSGSEYDIMRRDVEICGECGADAVVLGLLHADGNIDLDRTAMLVEYASPMHVTFHRAFDMCRDPVQGLEDIIAAGADRLLTSGQKNSAIDGVSLIHQLVMQGGERIIIMPGGGITEHNVEGLVKATHAREIHLTARSGIESSMIFRQAGISMGGISNVPEFTRKIADPERIKSVIKILNMI